MPRGFLKKSIQYSVYALAMVVLFVGGLKIIDRLVGRRGEQAGLTHETTIRTQELFPYDGFHVQANFQHRGPMPWELHTPDADFEVTTGDKGFFIDFSLENPPPKAANEFRIILIGGSGAQGWGATSNDKMFYSVLERTLNQSTGPQGVRVRVINLAMGGTVTYQNFVALNLWGHALEPDLILAYVGRNDFYVPLAHSRGTDAYAGFGDVAMLTVAARGDEYPRAMAWLVDLLPNIMRRTSIGLGIKLSWGWDFFRERAWQSYAASRGQRRGTRREALDENILPALIHSLRSIKRDFAGVPIMVAWQPIREELELTAELGPDFYDAMYERVGRELSGYKDSRWYFLNLHQISRAFPEGNFRFHLDNVAHEITGRLLSTEIVRVLPVLLEDRAQRVARGLPAGYGR